MLYVRRYIVVFLMLSGCATRQTAPSVYRLVNTGPARILVPPGVADPELAVRTFDYRLQSRAPSSCRTSNDALRVEPHGASLRITVRPAPLVAHPAPWLADWALSIERQGCISAGASGALAKQIVESVPLHPDEEHRLLNASTRSSLDLAAGYRLKLISPILREGAKPGASALETDPVTGTDTKLSLTVKASADFLGYEVSWYALQGAHIVFVTAESHIDNQVITSTRPRVNHFAFPDNAAFYRLFYLTRVSEADHNVVILSASTRDDLDRMTTAFDSDPDACTKAPPKACVALPNEVAVTTYLTVMANGAPLEVPVVATVSGALREAGVKQPATVLPTLSIRRDYRGALVPVEFDRGKPDILTLILTGNEELRW